MIQTLFVIITSISILSACNLNIQPEATVFPEEQSSQDSPTQSAVPASPMPEPIITLTPYPDELWFDALEVMSGICFESAFDARNQVFILRSADALANFFDLADNSRLCRRPVERGSFDFSQGHILAGFWSYGSGCTAGHEVVSADKDDQAKVLTLYVRFFTEGECPYELVRPFWIGLSGVSDYSINILPAQP